MRSLFVSFVLLSLTWLLLSGVYKGLIIALGLLSVLLTIYFVRRMDRVDGYAIHFSINIFKFLGYFFWLLLEIAKSNIEVVKAIIKGNNHINKQMIFVSTSQRSDLGKVIFANSITLTPGTISLSLENNKVCVHALNFKESSIKDLEEMDRRVKNIEIGS